VATAATIPFVRRDTPGYTGAIGTPVNQPDRRDAGTSLVGGSALPGGVMMRSRNRVGIAVRREEDGEIVTEGFDLEAPTARWTRLPLMRGVTAIRTAVSTGQRSMAIGERLRWEQVGPPPPAEEGEPEGIGFWGKVAVAVGALVGAGVQIAAFRIGPIVIAKEAGLEGAAFIVADAMIRLLLLLGTLLLLSLFRPFRKILRYHGAEHQAIAAHEAGSPLTAAAAAGFSRFHPRCGTSFLVVSALVSIAVYGAVLAVTGVFTYPALIATRLLGAPIVTAIAFEIQRQAARHADGPLHFLSAPGMWAQRLTTAPPRAQELEVACAALAVALEQPQGAPARAPEGEDADPALDPAPPLGAPQPSSV
jgi:uncharacterized protein YqhQ